MNLAARIPPLGTATRDEILDRFLGWVTERGLDLYPAQEEAILELMSGKHVVLGTPTGSGKSLVAEALHFKAICEGQRSCYTSPIKALASEKFFALCQDFGASNVGMMTGDASINRDAPIICCTAEVLSNMALRQSTDLGFPYVVIDEFHYYADRDRGVAWQIPLLTLPRTTFLLMSATLGDTTPIEQSLTRLTGTPVARVVSEQRPVPLDFEYREELLHETVESLLEKNRAPVYVVSFTQRECAERAQALTSAKVCDRDQKRALGEAIAGFRFDSPYGGDVRRFVSHGIGVHHAGLLPKYRLLVEQLAQQGLLRVICGTDTLGVGVNIPIRTVLFSQLCKFDGQKTAILSVRDFKQISGRAGRKGFDERGWVVALAPEHVVENKRLDAKAAAGKKVVKKKPPTRGYVAWNAETFEKLRTSAPEPLQSRFTVAHGMMLSVLQRDPADVELPGGYRAIVELVKRCHESDRMKARLEREAAVVFRSLRRASIIELAPRVSASGSAVPRGRTVRVSDKLQPDFSLHTTLSLYLVEVISVLDPSSPSYALDVLSFVESVLENPRPVLERQIDRAKGELIGRLKSEGVPYEERMEALEKVSYPKPNEELIYATFNVFSEKHPWVRSENIRPKSIAREMIEGYFAFEGYVRDLEIARVEGLLLRYLNQVHNTLTRSVPLEAKTDAVFEVTAFFRVMLARVDSSLVKEWESLMGVESGAVTEPAPSAATSAPVPPAGKALLARLRVELHRLVAALAAKDWAEAARCVRPGEDAWDAKRFEQELAPFVAEHARVVFDARARLAQFTHVARSGPQSWSVQQTLLDPEDENVWAIHGEVDLGGDVALDHPLIRVVRIGP